MPFNLSEVVNDPDLAQRFSILRSSGKFGLGGFKSTTTEVPSYGVITVADAEAWKRHPQMDQITGAMQVNCAKQIYQTSEERSALSDIVVWRGVKYRVISVSPWGDFGFYNAIITRMPGQ